MLISAHLSHKESCPSFESCTPLPLFMLASRSLTCDCHVQGGHDAGDHPPITPIASATEAELGGGDNWRLYDYIARHFLGSLSPDCVVSRTTAHFAAGAERFSAEGVSPKRAGFTAIMPWKVRALRFIIYCFIP